MPGNVLLVTQNFPPTNEIASRRFGSIAPQLEQHGWTAWVLTTHGRGPLPVRLPPERIFRIGANSNRLPATLAEGQQSGRARGPLVVLRDSIRAAARWMVDRSGSRVYALYPANLAWHRAVVRETDAIRRWLPHVDVIVGSFLPAAGPLIAAHFSKVLGAPWLADIRDIASLIPGRRHPLARGMDRWIERRLFRTAAGFLSVSPTLVRILETTYRRRAAVIYNGWDPDSECESDPAAGWSARAATPDNAAAVAAEPYLYYAGLLYPHRLPAAEAILAALAGQPRIAWKLRSLGPAGLEQRLMNEARRLGLGRRVEILPPADPAVIARESGDALANVVLEDLDCRQLAGRGTLTGKFLKLLPSPPAVLAVARADSDIGPILARTRKGRLCSTADEIAAFLRAVHERPGVFRGDLDAIAEFSMAAQAARLARVLDAQVGEPSARQGVGWAVPTRQRRDPGDRQHVGRGGHSGGHAGGHSPPYKPSAPADAGEARAA